VSSRGVNSDSSGFHNILILNNKKSPRFGKISKKLSVTFLDKTTAHGQSGYSTLLELIHKEMVLVAYELAGRPEKLKNIEIRTLNHRFIRSAIWVKEKANQIIIRCCKNHPLYDWYKEAQVKLKHLVYRLMKFSTA
jgi:hypothetical protein